MQRVLDDERVLVSRVVDVERLGALAEAEQVEGDEPVAGPDGVDDRAPVAAVGVDAVQHHDGGTRALVEVRVEP